MANHPKDPRKTEFIELFRRTGWTQAELARKLEMTRGGVNGIVTGPTIPSAAALQFLRLTLLAERPQALGGTGRLSEFDLAPWEKKLVHDLRRLAPEDRATVLETFKTLAAGFRSKPAGVTPAKPAEADAKGIQAIATAGAKSAVHQLRSGAAERRQSYRKKQKVASTTGKTSARAATAVAH